MKITKTQLRQIIKEEVEKQLSLVTEMTALERAGRDKYFAAVAEYEDFIKKFPDVDKEKIGRYLVDNPPGGGINGFREKVRRMLYIQAGKGKEYDAARPKAKEQPKAAPEKTAAKPEVSPEKAATKEKPGGLYGKGQVYLYNQRGDYIGPRKTTGSPEYTLTYDQAKAKGLVKPQKYGVTR